MNLAKMIADAVRRRLDENYNQQPTDDNIEAYKEKLVRIEILIQKVLNDAEDRGVKPYNDEKTKTWLNKLGAIRAEYRKAVSEHNKKKEHANVSSLIQDALRKFEHVRKPLCKKATEENSSNLTGLYPQEYFPFLWEPSHLKGKFEFKYFTFYEVPGMVHTIWRGTTVEEIQYILKNKHVKSNQSMNMGYEVEQGLTVFSFYPSSAKHYASGFAPEENQPTTEKPNYLMQIRVTPNDGVFIDKNDEYVKTAKAIPSNQIEYIWEVRHDGSINDVTSRFNF